LSELAGLTGGVARPFNGRIVGRQRESVSEVTYRDQD